MTTATTAKSKALCRGCYYDDYNHGLGGAKGCWSFDSAEVCARAFVHLSMMPPWKVPLETTLTCYQRPKHVAVRPGDSRLTDDEEHQQKYDGGDY